MAARVLWTTGLLLLALGGFFGLSPTPAAPLNLSGILFLALSGAVWFGWPAIRDAYAYRDEIARRGRGRRDLMIVRLGPVMVNRLVRGEGEELR